MIQTSFDFDNIPAHDGQVTDLQYRNSTCSGWVYAGDGIFKKGERSGFFDEKGHFHDL